ncbi:MAG: restriction endonuclease subunit S [Bacteroidales bacterium]|nr:restriction endonuclease subunit S [Bacteroidales bacterium]
MKINDLCYYQTERILIDDINLSYYITTDNMLQNCEGIRNYEGSPKTDSMIKYQENDILVSNIRPYLKKIWFANRTGGCSPDVLVFRVKDKEKYDAHFVYYALTQDSFFEHMMLGAKGMKMPRGDKNSILEYEIPVPSIEDQQKIVKQIETYEATIVEAKAVMDSCAERKKMVFEKWLR